MNIKNDKAKNKVRSLIISKCLPFEVLSLSFLENSLKISSERIFIEPKIESKRKQTVKQRFLAYMSPQN